MALAWAQAQAELNGAGVASGSSPLNALLAASGGAAAAGADASSMLLSRGAGGEQTGGTCASGGAAAAVDASSGGAKAAPSRAGEVPPVYVLVLTQVLPDGLGDVVFGESAVQELQLVAPVVWIRCYTGEENVAAGESLVADTSRALPYSASCSGQVGLDETVGADKIRKLWNEARERFLAPWIFGLSTHEQRVLGLAQGTGKAFWATTEYGRGMGNIHSYTGGLGAMIPTGWTVNGEPGGVFRSILRAPRTDTDWRRFFAERVGVERSLVRLWWFYSRKDDEKKHDFRLLSDTGARPRLVAKMIPVGPDGNIITDPKEKTNGEKLAEQLFQAAADPNFKPTTDVSCAEASAGCAGALSQFIWGILFDEGYTYRNNGPEKIDVVVTPNIMTAWREADGGDSMVAEVTQLDLLSASARKEAPLPAGRRLFVVSARVPRGELRTFLEQCEERVFTTGDQSLAEAMFLGKLPGIRPDAKVNQWQLAIMAKAMGSIEAVPDLGLVLRRLVEDGAAREAARSASRRRSDDVERQIIAQLGAPPAAWSPTHQVLARAGMLG